MSMKVNTGRDSDIPNEPNVVPLCDILLVLLIIFMVMTPLIQKGVDVELPTAINTIDQPENVGRSPDHRSRKKALLKS